MLMAATYTIIIPHHNIPSLLQRCLHSIPDIYDIQVIIVDDNSSPNIVNFSSFPGQERKFTEFIFDKKGYGAGYARNLGLQRAKGKWILFADADDYFVQNFYTLIYAHKDSDAQLVLFKALSVNSDTLEPSFRHIELNNAIEQAIIGNITPKEASICMATPWCRLFANEFIKNKHILYDEIMSSNDVMFVTKATCWAQKVTVDSNPLYTVTHRKGSLANSQKDSSNYLCRFEVMIRKNQFLKDYPYPKLFIFEFVIRAAKIDFTTFLQALYIAYRNHALTSGFSSFLKTIKNKFKVFI